MQRRAAPAALRPGAVVRARPARGRDRGGDSDFGGPARPGESASHSELVDSLDVKTCSMDSCRRRDGFCIRLLRRAAPAPASALALALGGGEDSGRTPLCDRNGCGCGGR